MTSSAEPDQLASSEPIDLDLHCLQRQGISELSRIRFKNNKYSKKIQFTNILNIYVFGALSQKETGDNTILVRALDRFHRRLQAMNKLLPDTDFSRYYRIFVFNFIFPVKVLAR